MTLTLAPPEPATAPVVSRRRRLGDLLGTLEQLGNSAAIASFLAREGVRGTPGYGRICALAKWLAVETGEEMYVAIATAGYADMPVSARLPSPAREFVVDFDRLRYPGLLDSFKATDADIAQAAAALSKLPFTDAAFDCEFEAVMV